MLRGVWYCATAAVFLGEETRESVAYMESGKGLGPTIYTTRSHQPETLRIYRKCRINQLNHQRTMDWNVFLDLLPSFFFSKFLPGKITWKKLHKWLPEVLQFVSDFSWFLNTSIKSLAAKSSEKKQTKKHQMIWPGKLCSTQASQLRSQCL